MSRLFVNLFCNISKVPRRFLVTRLSTNERQNEVSIVQKKLILHDGERKLQYPLVWLRDNCQCSSCFHGSSRSRTIDWENFNTNPKIRHVEYNKDGSGQISITWEDNHLSVFDECWLLDRNFTPENRTKYLDQMYRPKKIYWTKDEFSKILSTFEYREVMETEEVLHDWLEALAKYGITIIKNTPLEKDEIRKLADRVAFIKNTHYGDVFEVKAKDDANNVAYNNGYLQLHTDLPYYEYKPGVNLLHCLIQSKAKGGENLISDGFHVAQMLKDQHPEYFRVLSQTMVNWNDVGKDGRHVFHSIYRAPVICLDQEGTFVRINYSVPQRDSFFSTPLEVVQFWYEAMAKFSTMLKEHSVTFKTKEGDVLTFDNIRMVHGRTGYEESKGNTRHLLGAYLDWDEIFSSLRVLKSRKIK